MHSQEDVPWLCAGDFNEILYQHEKEGGVLRPQAQMDRFREALVDCELQDLGFEGDVYTWRNNNRRAQGYVRERLDRALANMEWRAHFATVQVLNGDPRHSDHRPVIISTERKEVRNGGGRKAFFFEAAWLEEENCEEVVREGWELGVAEGLTRVNQLVGRVAGNLSVWSSNVLGVWEKRRKKLKKELECCRRRSLSDDVVTREAVLRFQIDKVEEQIDIYWKQRSHTRRLEKGDRNTKFFHAACSDRRRRNRIGPLQNGEGGLVEDEVEKQVFITNYFMQLFTSNVNGDVQQLLQAVQPRVTPAMNEQLMEDFTDEEIKEALDSIGDLKAPGPDGMAAIFYKKFWGIVGRRITDEVLEFLQGGAMPHQWNETIISLIPKVKQPDKVTDLRPISLCNVLYKIISKVLANRLKKILPEIISENQSAFVPGRLISDNILIAYELTHSLRKKKKGAEGWAAIKLDTSKAYDRVEWSFLQAMMIKMGFCHEWTQLIMNCLMSVSYRVKVNGDIGESFAPGRGLRQGDPLSPYLFLLCAEGFSALLSEAEGAGRIKGMKVCQRAPSISHLLFADDSLLLVRANRENAEEVQRILTLYEQVSGQTINKAKSAVLFSANTRDADRIALKNILQITNETMNDRYLGLPVHVGSSRGGTLTFST